MYADTLQPFVETTILFGCTAMMVLLSRKFFKGMLNKGGAGLQLDFYRVYGLLFLLAMNMDVLTGGPQFILEIIVALLIPAYFILMRSTTTGTLERNIPDGCSDIVQSISVLGHCRSAHDTSCT